MKNSKTIGENFIAHSITHQKIMALYFNRLLEIEESARSKINLSCA